jgi:predicted lipase
MAIMQEPDRTEVRSKIAQYLSKKREPINLTKGELKSAIDGVDQYLFENELLINQAIPQPARSELTKQQKALLMAYVTLRRYEVGV